ncbi:MAG TPA: RES domain-containing protein [Hyphomicrobiaceae bacterium]|nr:RES domain-containing protein [Hyphomicrobiaceae bacterium]
MVARKLERALRVFRIGDPAGRYPIWSGEGAARQEGRWHMRGQEVIYTSEHYSTAMLEKLAHFNGVLPAGQHFVAAEVPAGTTYEVVTKDSLPAWIDANAARAFGAAWLGERRSAILIVPCFVAREERNVLINPAHGEARAIVPGLETPVTWDERLFAAMSMRAR